MGNGYQINLEKFSIAKLKKMLKEGYLLPSQQILKEKLDERLGIIKQQGIENLLELQKALKTKSDVNVFAKKSGIPENFLTILRREVNSYKPKPRALNDFPDIDSKLIIKLEKMGIKNTIQFLDKTATKKDRKAIADDTGADNKAVEKLSRLSDVTRLRYVNATFATLLLMVSCP